MPIAARYREAALRFAGLAENMQRQAALVSGWRLDSQIGPGPFADVVVERLTWAAGELLTGADELARLAGVCRRRADVCDDYTRQVHAWWALPVLERGPYPDPPYAWVTG